MKKEMLRFWRLIARQDRIATFDPLPKIAKRKVLRDLGIANGRGVQEFSSEEMDELFKKASAVDFKSSPHDSPAKLNRQRNILEIFFPDANRFAHEYIRITGITCREQINYKTDRLFLEYLKKERDLEVTQDMVGDHRQKIRFLNYSKMPGESLPDYFHPQKERSAVTRSDTEGTLTFAPPDDLFGSFICKHCGERNLIYGVIEIRQSEDAAPFDPTEGVAF